MALRELHEDLPSTQDRAIELARQGAEDGSVVVARSQSLGRGRGDRRWESPPGGLYVSVVLRPVPAPDLLPLALGAELASALTEEYAVRLRLKWPNDLLAVDGAGAAGKLAGVLVDLVRTPGAGAAAVAGLGVNAGRWPVAVPAPSGAVGLEQLVGGPVDLGRLETVAVRSAVAARRALTTEDGERVVLARARGLLYGVGEPVTVDGRPVGPLRGLRDDGAIEVDSPAGRLAIRSGDVRVGVAR